MTVHTNKESAAIYIASFALLVLAVWVVKIFAGEELGFAIGAPLIVAGVGAIFISIGKRVKII